MQSQTELMESRELREPWELMELRELMDEVLDVYVEHEVACKTREISNSEIRAKS